MKQVTLSALLEILDEHRGAVIVTMVARTEPKLLAKSRATGEATVDRYPHGVEKLLRGRFMLANRYAANVRAQRSRERHPQPENFRADKLWAGKGQRLGRFLVRHKENGRLYIRARPASDASGYPVPIWQKWIDLASGEDVGGKQLEDLKANYLRDRPAANRKQQLARRIPYRTYQLVSIHTVTAGGQTYRIEPDRCAYTLNPDP